MTWLSELGRRLEMLFGGRRFDNDLEEEMRLHLELRAEEYEANGFSPREAGAAAKRRFGNATVLREVSGDAWGWRALEDFGQDLRYALRSLMQKPAFTAVGAITLALGIGANTALFSVVNSVLLRPLPYKNANRLVTLLHEGTDPVATANYIDWRDQCRSFEAMEAASYWTPNLTNNDLPEHLVGLRVTQNLLPMLGVAPTLGRLFARGEGRKGSTHEVVLSNRLWQRRFNGDPGVIGKPIVLNGEAYAVVGVMPPGFKFAPFWATRAELWVPDDFSEGFQNRGGNSLRVFARLKPDVTLEQARAEVTTVTGRLERQYPGTNRRVLVTPLKENVVGKVEIPLRILLCAVGFVLLIACANVAHMLLARSSDRQKETAVRTALGAGRMRIVAQCLTENLVLACIGSSLGLLLAVVGTKALVALSPTDIPRLDSVSIDLRVILFLFALTMATAITFGLAPALVATGGSLSAALKEGGRGDTEGVRRNRLRGLLVASEFALAFVLLIGAGLMVRSFSALQLVDPGFDPKNVLSMVVSITGSKEAEGSRREIFYRQLLDQVHRLPGVSSVGAINHLPLAGDIWGWPFLIEGRPKPRPGESPVAVYRIVMPGYFETMHISLKRGRSIAATDDARSAGVVIINERAAREYWPGQDPIGKRITFNVENNGLVDWLMVIGVAADAKQSDWAASPYPETYVAALQNREFMTSGAAHFGYITLVIRSNANPIDLAAGVKRTVWSFDRNLPISEVVTMEHAVADANSQPRFEMLLLSIFAGFALVLAVVGIYGVMNYAVARRRREIGIRMSLGATRLDVMRMVMQQGVLQAALGTITGVAGALLVSHLMTKMLYGVRPTDPLTFGGVVIVLGLAAMAAISVPARKATRIEPMVALREE
jgi:predicted permease